MSIFGPKMLMFRAQNIKMKGPRMAKQEGKGLFMSYNRPIISGTFPAQNVNMSGPKC